VRLLFLGAGNRGFAYARHAQALGARILGVADPRSDRLEAFRRAFGAAYAFRDWRELADLPQLAEAAVVALPDRLHAEAAVALMEKGYHLLLEKPIAPTWEEVARVAEAKARTGRMVAVAHVLRYTPYAQTLKGLLGEGAIGEPVSVQHLEPVGHWHYAHSFVRGNWRREEESSPFLLAKAVHDLDWLLFVLPGEVCCLGRCDGWLPSGVSTTSGRSGGLRGLGRDASGARRRWNGPAPSLPDGSTWRPTKGGNGAGPWTWWPTR